MKSSKRIVPLPCLSNFLTKVSTKPSESLYPKVVSAILSSFLSIFPEWSLSKERKQFCQSVTYFHNAPKSSKLTWPLLCLSNIPSNCTNLITQLQNDSFRPTNHQTNRFLVKRGPSSVRKRSLQLVSVDVTTSIPIHSAAKQKQPLSPKNCTLGGRSTYFWNMSHRNSRFGMGDWKVMFYVSLSIRWVKHWQEVWSKMSGKLQQLRI